MPSRKKKKKNKNKSTTGFRPVGNSCSNCGRPGTDASPLRDCGRCGTASYCSKECQRQAYPEHKAWCQQTAMDYNADDKSALKRILFSRCFGGAVSLLMHQAQGIQNKTGLIHAVCSHPFVDYCGRRRSEDKRSITLSFIPEGEALLELQENALGPSQPKRDEEGPGWLESTMDCKRTFVRTFGASQAFGEDFDKRVAIVAMQQPGVQFLKVYIFVSYMSADHMAHESYHDLLHDGRWPDISTSVILDWDWNTSRQPDPNDLDYPLQWMFYNSIRAQFYQECSLAWQEKARNNDPSPWPGGVLTPPLALGMNMSNVSIASGNPYTISFST